MKWDVYVYDPRSKSTVTHVLEYPRTSRSGGAAVVQMAARDLSVSPDRVLALPHRGSAEPPRGGRADDGPGSWQSGYDFARESALHETRAEQRQVLRNASTGARSPYNLGLVAGYEDALGIPRSKVSSR